MPGGGKERLTKKQDGHTKYGIVPQVIHSLTSSFHKYPFKTTYYVLNTVLGSGEVRKKHTGSLLTYHLARETEASEYKMVNITEWGPYGPESRGPS